MSQQQRQSIMYWFTLIAGMAILAMQIYKYWEGTLSLEVREIIVTLCAVGLMINPNVLFSVLKTKFTKNDK